MAWNDDTMSFDADSNPSGGNSTVWNDYTLEFDPAISRAEIDALGNGHNDGAASWSTGLDEQLPPSGSSWDSFINSEQTSSIAAQRDALNELLSDPVKVKSLLAEETSKPPEEQNTDWVKALSKALGGDKAVAALIQGGFGMLSGYSNGMMLEEKMKNDRRTRDEEWARKDQNSYAGKIQRTDYGLLGSANK